MLAAILVVVLLVSACAPGISLRIGGRVAGADPPPARPRAVATQRPPTAELEQVLELVNARRAGDRRCGDEVVPGAPPLVWEPALSLASERHARSMAEHGYVAHRGLDGSSAGDRIAATGFRASGWGETIAAGFDDARSAVDALFDSPSHCRVLMAEPFELLGAARVDLDGSVHGTYWTILVAVP